MGPNLWHTIFMFLVMNATVRKRTNLLMYALKRQWHILKKKVLERQRSL